MTVRSSSMRRAAAAALLALALPPQAEAFNLDPCSTKPTFSASRCAEGSAIACWSKTGTWRCWPRGWEPQWALRDGSAAADAECMAHAAVDEGPFDGACTLEEPSAADEVELPSRQRDWAEARQKATALLQQMNLTEKRMLMSGVGWRPSGGWYDLEKWYYIGGTEPIPRLGIPSLNIQDSSAGFRTLWSDIVGTVTAFPSLLAMSATWDPLAVRAYAYAVGEEFVGKGANVVLGPGVNVARVARNGRNFEYISGEDPVLGSVLAKAYVEGVQAHDLIAVMKHWVLNNQETHRGDESSDVDRKTAEELYYPPFKAAVDAGVDATMCSYNRVDGVYSCENAEQLGVLKNEMGFQGFVQSDWWATHSTSVVEGLDQDMPGVPYDNFMEEDLAKIDSAAVNESVVRILSAMYRANVMETTQCAPPHCKEYFMKNVTSDKHAFLTRRLAAESIVMLKNEDGALPLSKSKTTKIAIVGAAANAKPFNPDGSGQSEADSIADAWRIGDLYSGGGSGHMVGGYVVSALAGIQDRARAEGIELILSLTNDAAEAVKVAAQADLTLAVVGTWSGEAADRKDLHLDSKEDELIEAVALVSKTVVLMEIPGAVVMPWRHAVSAILTMFLGGQETGHAWASVLFGDTPPTGRLPLTMPETESDTIAPSEGAHAVYSEGLKMGYRNPDFKAAFAFGHGLTYTTFEYENATTFECGSDVCVTVSVKNTGSAAARTVAQLYVEFPAESGHPAPFLKSFQKTPVLLPGSVGLVNFRLTDHDLSYYQDGQVSSGFVRAPTATMHIGESSADIRIVLPLQTGPVESSLVMAALCGGSVASVALAGMAVRKLRMAFGEAHRAKHSLLKDAEAAVE